LGQKLANKLSLIGEKKLQFVLAQSENKLAKNWSSLGEKMGDKKESSSTVKLGNWNFRLFPQQRIN